MKKILLIALLAITCSSAYAQTALLTIKNTTDSCTAYILVYATSPTLAGGIGSCTDIVTGGTIGPGGTMSAASPYQWQTTYGFGGSITSVCVGPCPSYPSDFEWTFSNIDLNCPCGGDMASVNVGNTSYSCPLVSSTTYGPGACAGHYIQWTYVPGTLADITITIW